MGCADAIISAQRNALPTVQPIVNVQIVVLYVHATMFVPATTNVPVIQTVPATITVPVILFVRANLEGRVMMITKIIDDYLPVQKIRNNLLTTLIDVSTGKKTVTLPEERNTLFFFHENGRVRVALSHFGNGFLLKEVIPFAYGVRVEKISRRGFSLEEAEFDGTESTFSLLKTDIEMPEDEGGEDGVVISDSNVPGEGKKDATTEVIAPEMPPFLKEKLDELKSRTANIAPVFIFSRSDLERELSVLPIGTRIGCFSGGSSTPFLHLGHLYSFDLVRTRSDKTICIVIGMGPLGGSDISVGERQQEVIDLYSSANVDYVYFNIEEQITLGTAFPQLMMSGINVDESDPSLALLRTDFQIEFTSDAQKRSMAFEVNLAQNVQRRLASMWVPLVEICRSRGLDITMYRSIKDSFRDAIAYFGYNGGPPFLAGTDLLEKGVKQAELPFCYIPIFRFPNGELPLKTLPFWKADEDAVNIDGYDRFEFAPFPSLPDLKVIYYYGEWRGQYRVVTTVEGMSINQIYQKYPTERLIAVSERETDSFLWNKIAEYTVNGVCFTELIYFDMKERM